MDWGTRVTTIGLEFALPAFLGFGLDRWWSTAPWMTILGAFLGLGIGMVHMVRLATELSATLQRKDETLDRAPPVRTSLHVIQHPGHPTHRLVVCLKAS